MTENTTCGEYKPGPTTTNDPCVLNVGHEGMHECRHGEFWGGQPSS